MLSREGDVGACTHIIYKVDKLLISFIPAALPRYLVSTDTRITKYEGESNENLLYCNIIVC